MGLYKGVVGSTPNIGITRASNRPIVSKARTKKGWTDKLVLAQVKRVVVAECAYDMSDRVSKRLDFG